MSLALSHSHEHEPSPRPTMPCGEYEIAMAALDRAIQAITHDALEKRFMAVRDATEAVTSLYLNMNASIDSPRPDELSEMYSCILGHLLRINLYNDPGAASRAMTLLRRWHLATRNASASRTIHRIATSR